MIEKMFVNSKCISCGEDTPVIFVVRDITGYPLYRIPLCRKCSNKFAEDVITTLRDKVKRSHEAFETKCQEVKNLKKKVWYMNKRSHNHKKIITDMIKNKG